MLDKEIPNYNNSAVIDTAKLTTQVRDCVLVLTSTPPVFAATVIRTLVVRMKLNSDFKKRYVAVPGRAYGRPPTCAHFLTDRYGKPPSERM